MTKKQDKENALIFMISILRVSLARGSVYEFTENNPEAMIAYIENHIETLEKRLERARTNAKS